jgi:hypothetical protein
MPSRLFLALHALEPRADVVRKAAELAELAVVNDVEAGVDLLPDDFLDVPGQRLEELVAVGDLAKVDLREARRPRQRADVGAENTVRTAFHGAVITSHAKFPYGMRLRLRDGSKLSKAAKRGR